MFSGSTFNLCIIKKDLLYVTNIGDSRAVIGFEDSGTSFSKALSYDHHPDVEGERRRIIKNNGRISRIINKKGFGVGPLRVWLKTEDVPGLAMTRSIGDMVAGSIGVTWKPEIAIYRLCTEDRVLVVGSDGLWEMISNNTVGCSNFRIYWSFAFRLFEFWWMGSKMRDWRRVLTGSWIPVWRSGSLRTSWMT